MGNIIKVNFNNAKIKLPSLISPQISWVDNKTILIYHNNLETFDEVRMKIYVDDEFKIDTYEDKIEYIVGEEAATKNNYKVTIEMIGTVSKLNKTYAQTLTIENFIACSEQVVCSNNLTCQE